MEINRDNLLTLIRTGIKNDGKSVLGLEREAGVPKDTIRDFLRGKTHVLRADKLQKILRILGPHDRIAIAGLAGKGAEIIFHDKDTPGALGMVDCPPGFEPQDVVAIRIQGDAMLPVFHDGWIIYYSRRQDISVPAIPGGWQVPYAPKGEENGDPFAGVLGKPCVIGVGGGKTLLGTLKRSARKSGYDLINYNEADIANIQPEWAAKIIFIRTQ